MRQRGASLTMVERQNATQARIVGVTGGTQQNRVITAGTPDDLELRIQEAKEEIGAARTPFFSIERVTPPFVFTVTRLAQIGTFYYFLFFLVLLPILGLRETPGRVPDTIAKPVMTPAE
jgi:ubiquinol-cytochrome c reductase cytochrome b subunit